MSRAIPRVVDDRGIPLHINDFLPTEFSTTLVDNKDNPLIKPLLQEFTELNQQLANLLYTTAEYNNADDQQYYFMKLLYSDDWIKSNLAIYQEQRKIGAEITRHLSTLEGIPRSDATEASIEKFVQGLNAVEKAWPSGDIDCAITDIDELNDFLINLGRDKEVNDHDLWEQLADENLDVIEFDAMEEWFVKKTPMFIKFVKRRRVEFLDVKAEQVFRVSDASPPSRRTDASLRSEGQSMGRGNKERSNSIGGGTKNKKRNKKYSKKKSKRSKRSRSRSKQRRSKRSLSKSRSKRSKRSKRR